MYGNVFTGDRAIDEPWFSNELDQYFELYGELPIGLIREFDTLFGAGAAKQLASKHVRLHDLVMQELGDEK